MHQFSFKPLKNKALRAEVAEEIIRAIAFGSLKPGERIVEQHVAEQMQISRAPVREALRELEAQGIIYTIDRKGSFVTDLTIEDVTELFSLRSILEGLAVRLAAQRISDSDVSELESLTESMRKFSAAGDLAGFVQCDIRFHQLIFQRSNHKLLIHMLEGVQNLTKLFMTLSKQSLLAENQLTTEASAHKPIILALKARDSQQSEQAIHEHITQAGERLIRHLKSGLDIKSRE